MNRIHHRRQVRRIAAVLGAFAASALALVTGATAAFAYPVHPPGGPRRVPLPTPPGWNKHLPLPVQAHTAVIGGMPGWQIALIAIGAAIVAAALAVTVDRTLAARRRVSAHPA